MSIFNIQLARSSSFNILQKLCKLCNKNPNFPKQHAVNHVVMEIRTKGATDNYGTRVGEGFQQESAQAYAQTNGKNAEAQASLSTIVICIGPFLKYSPDGPD